MVTEYRSKKEVWRPVEDYPLYYVSNTGRLISLSNINSQLELGKFPNKKGYIRVELYNNFSIRRTMLHCIVLETFSCKRPNGMQCCHRDGDKLNNDIKNLYWGTPKDNARDRDRHGKTYKGEIHWNSKLKEKDIIEIRKLRSKFGYSSNILSKMYNVSNSNIKMILS